MAVYLVRHEGGSSPQASLVRRLLPPSVISGDLCRLVAPEGESAGNLFRVTEICRRGRIRHDGLRAA